MFSLDDEDVVLSQKSNKIMMDSQSFGYGQDMGFTKFSVVVTTNNQQALTVAKALVKRWFHVYGIPSRIHSDQGKSFDNKIIDALCKMY